MFCSIPKGRVHKEQGMRIWVTHSGRCLGHVAQICVSIIQAESQLLGNKKGKNVFFTFSFIQKFFSYFAEPLSSLIQMSQSKQQLTPSVPLCLGVFHQISCF